MITLGAHPEVHVIEQQPRPVYATCHECHRSFRPKSEDQLSLEVCDSCFDKLRQGSEPIASVHVKVLPRHKPRSSQ